MTARRPPATAWRGALRIALLSAASTAAAACSSTCRAQPTPAADAAPAEPVARIDIQSRGAEPRVLLQIGRWAGLRYTSTFSTESSFGVEGGPPVKAPTLIAALRTEVLRGTADPVVRETDAGTLRLVQERSTIGEFGIDPQGLPPAVAEAANRNLSLIAGSATLQLVEEDGEVVEMRTELLGGFEPPRDVADALDETLDAQRRFPFRLPSGPVGVGAKWRFSDPIRLRGIRLTQVADMSLIAIDEGSARIRIRLRLQAPRQEVPHPLDPTATATLEQYRGDGDGEMRIDRLTGIVLEARVATTGTLRLSALTPQGQKTTTLSSATVLRVTGALTREEPTPAPTDAAALTTDAGAGEPDAR